MIQEMIKQQGEHLLHFGGGLMEFFLHRNGQAYTPVVHDLPMGEMKQCYANTARFIMNQPQSGPFKYCEGLAIRRSLGILMGHAWLVDKLGNAYDLTWKGSHECEYFGVVFEKNMVMRELNRNGCYGLLDTGMYNVRLMQKIDPSLMDEFRPLADERKAKLAAIAAKLG
jgi:hypothetical protein